MSSPIDVLLIDLSTTSLRTTPPPFVSMCGLCHNCANYNHHIGMDTCIPRTIHLFVVFLFSRQRTVFEHCFRHFLTLIGSDLFFSFFHNICLLLARLEYYLRVHLFLHVIYFLNHINTCWVNINIRLTRKLHWCWNHGWASGNCHDYSR